MDLKIYRIDKDFSTKTKYVVTASKSDLPTYFSTSSNGETPVYIYGEKYGRPNIRGMLKLVGKKGHISTLFSANENYKGFEVFSGDVKDRNDLILLFASLDFRQLYIVEFKGEKKNRYQILTNLFKGGLDERLEGLELI